MMMEYIRMSQLELDGLLQQGDYQIELKGVCLEEVDLSNVFLNRAVFENCCIKNSNFSGMRTMNLQMVQSYIINSDFSNCSLGKPACSYEEPEHSVSFNQCRIQGSCFYRADLTAVEWKACFIEDTDFKGCIFSGIMFKDNKVFHSDFTAVKAAGWQPVFECLEFYDCILNQFHYDFGVEVVLNNLVFENCQLKKICLNRTSLDNLSFENCVLSGSQFLNVKKTDKMYWNNCILEDVYMDFDVS